MNLPFWQRTEGVRANNKRAVLVVYSKESPCLLRCTIALPKKSSVEPDAPTTAQSYGMLFCFRRRSEGVQGAFRSSPACIAAHQLRRRGILAEGLTRRLRRGWWAAAPRGAVLSFEAKESTKESTRHGDSRGGPPRCALFANIGVPGTAVPDSCICSGLPVANCLRQLCPLGTRSLSAQASACGSPSGCPLPRFALLTRREKALDCPFLKEGVRNVARRLVGEITHAIGRARAHSFPLSKRARLFPSAAYRRSAPPQLALGRLK